MKLWIRVAILAALVLSAATTATPGIPQGLEASFLGFRVDEERHYEMGPPAALNDGEWATWRIRLLRVEDGRGVFSVFHERWDPASPGLLPRLERDDVYEDPEYERAEGEIHLSGAGFPLSVRFHGTQRFINRTFEYAAEYDLTGGELHWDVQHVLGAVHENVPLPDELQLHPEEPEGLFLYYGADMRCVGRGTSMQWVADVFKVSEPCDEPDLLFANPGLLGIALHVSSRVDDEVRDLWFLSPVGALFDSDLPKPWGRVSRQGRTDYGYRDVDESQHFLRLRFETFGPKEIEVGGQPVASTEIYVQELARSVFVDAEGTVLRVDLGRHPVSGAPRWIRLLPRLD